MHRRQLIALLCTLGTLRSPLAEEGLLLVRDLYNKDQSFSDIARQYEGRSVRVTGYMAPPLKADSRFFVLTKRPMAVCPFCETEAEWPDDILAVYTRRGYDVAPFNRRIVVAGRLTLGRYVDADTGFLSMVRVENSRFEYA